MFFDNSISLSDTAQTENPAGNPHAFCVDDKIKSISESSNSSGISADETISSLKAQLQREKEIVYSNLCSKLVIREVRIKSVMLNCRQEMKILDLRLIRHIFG